MSRDWAPWEHLEAEKDNIKNGLGSIWDFLGRVTISYGDVKGERLCSDEELALRKEFPLLGKLLSNEFVPLYEKLSGLEGGIELLHSKDRELAVFVETGKGNKDAPVIKWFLGELDPHFYYGEHNNKLFAQSVLEEAKELSGVKKRLYEDYKQVWYANHSVSKQEIDSLMKEYADDVAAERFFGSFESYELEFGYHGGEVYASFEEFLGNEYQLLLEHFHSFKPGDFVNITVSDCCTGLAKVLEVTDSSLRVEMVEEKYFMCYPNSQLACNPMVVSFDLVLEIEVIDPGKYMYGNFPKSVSEILSNAVARSSETANNGKGDVAHDVEIVPY